MWSVGEVLNYCIISAAKEMIQQQFFPFSFVLKCKNEYGGEGKAKCNVKLIIHVLSALTINELY